MNPYAYISSGFYLEKISQWKKHFSSVCVLELEKFVTDISVYYQLMINLEIDPESDKYKKYVEKKINASDVKINFDYIYDQILKKYFSYYKTNSFESFPVKGFPLT